MPYCEPTNLAVIACPGGQVFADAVIAHLRHIYKHRFNLKVDGILKRYSKEKDALIKDVKELKGKTLIVTKGTTAETYFEKNHPEVKLQKYDQYSDAYQALLDGRGDAFSTDNTEVLAWALENKGYEVGITSLGDPDTIAPAVQKGNKELLDFINKDIEKLGKENFFHKAYEKTLHPTYGDAAKADDLVVEGGQVK